MIARVIAVVAAWELGWWARRLKHRGDVYAQAEAKARELGRPLVVVGAPDRGSTGGYGCGDVSVDIGPSACPAHMQADITRRLPFADDSVVVFVSCVLEYVIDYQRALQELHRVSGGWLYVVRVEPWTFSAYLYPGRRRTLPPPHTFLLPRGR